MKKNVLLTSILTIVLCLSLCVGGTFALFTSEDTTDIGVTSGKVNVSAKIDVESAKTYSMDILQADGNFSNGGFSTVTENAVTLDKVTPGDKVTFNINIVNNSNVITKYRSKVTCVEGFELYGLLNITFDGLQPTWQQLAVGEGNKTIAVVVELPQIVGNEAQDLSTKLVFAVEAVQGNAEVVDEVMTKVETVSSGSVVVPADNTQDVVVKATNGALKVKVPANRVDGALNKIDIKSTPITNSTDQSKFTIRTGAEAVYYDIDVAGLNAETSKCTVEIFIGKGLTGVKAYHNKDGEIVEMLPGYKKDSFSYNSATGYVTFKTSSFSPFAIEAFDASLLEFVNKYTIELNGKGTPEENGEALALAIANSNWMDIKLNDGQYDITKKIDIPEVWQAAVTGINDNAVINFKNEEACFSMNHAGKTFNNVPFMRFNNLTINANDSTAFVVGANSNIILDVKGTTNNGKIAKTLDNGQLDITGGEYKSIQNAEMFDIAATSGFEIGDGSKFVGFNPTQYISEGYVIKKNNTYDVLDTSTLNFVGDVTLQNDIYMNPANKMDNYTAVYKIEQDLNLNLNGHGIYFVNNPAKTPSNIPALFFVTGAVTVNIFGNGTIDTEFGNNTAYVLDIQNPNAVVNVKDGNFTASPTAFQVTQGTLNVSGGKFELTKSSKENSANPKYLINCIDRFFKNGTAKISVNGGTFVGTDLNDVEGANTTYIADGHVAMETEVAGTYKIIGSDFFNGNVKLTDDLVIPVPTTAGSGLRPFFTITKDCTIDMNGHTIKTNYKEGSINGVPCFMAITDAVTVTITGNGIMDAEAGDNSCYCINVNNAEAVLNIENGTFLGAPTGIQVQKGTLNVKGGNFDMAASCKAAAPGMAKYTINCIDSSFKDGTAKINVTGGTFTYDVSANPEGEGTTYVVTGYQSVNNGDGTFTVVKA